MGKGKPTQIITMWRERHPGENEGRFGRAEHFPGH